MELCGLQPTIFEQKPNVGGLWCTEKGTGSPPFLTLQPKLLSNISRHGVGFSDFPWSTPFESDFPSFAEVQEYCIAYKNEVLESTNVLLNTVVVRIERIGKDKWDIYYYRCDDKDTKPGLTYIVKEFDFLVVTSGTYSAPYWPDVGNLSRYNNSHDNPDKKIKLFHSSEYYENVNNILATPVDKDIYPETTILVIGGSISSTEIAADLALRASALFPDLARRNRVQILHVFPKAAWIYPRYLPSEDSSAPGFLPLDMALYDARRYSTNPRHADAVEGFAAQGETMRIQLGGDQSWMSPASTISPKQQKRPNTIAISDSYGNFVRSREIRTILGRFEVVDGSCYIRRNDGKLMPLTATHIILCTGYKSSMADFLRPVLPDLGTGVMAAHPPWKGTDLPPQLYLQTLHPKLPHTIGFVGILLRPFWTVQELQGRWLAKLFSGQCKWPEMTELQTGSGELQLQRLWDMGDYMEWVDRLCEAQDVPSFTYADAADYEGADTDLRPFSSAFFSTFPTNDGLIKEGKGMRDQIKETLKTDMVTKNLSIAVFRALHGKWFAKIMDQSNIKVNPGPIFWADSLPDTSHLFFGINATVEFRARMPGIELQKRNGEHTIVSTQFGNQYTGLVLSPNPINGHGDLQEYGFTASYDESDSPVNSVFPQRLHFKRTVEGDLVIAIRLGKIYIVLMCFKATMWFRITEGSNAWWENRCFVSGRENENMMGSNARIGVKFRGPEIEKLTISKFRDDTWLGEIGEIEWHLRLSREETPNLVAGGDGGWPERIWPAADQTAGETQV